MSLNPPQRLELSVQAHRSRKSVIELPSETLDIIFSYLPSQGLKSVSLACSVFRNIAASRLYRNVSLHWDKKTGFSTSQFENILTSSEFALRQIRRIQIIPYNPVFGNVGESNKLSTGLKPSEDLLFRLLLRKVGKDQLRSISVSSSEGIGADSAALLLNTQRNLAHLDLCVLNETVDILPMAFSIGNLKSFGFHIGKREEPVSRAFAFMYHVLKRNAGSLTSIFLSFNKDSGLYQELVRDSALPPTGEYDSATIKIHQLFLGSSDREDMIFFPALQQLHMQCLPNFGTIFTMGDDLTERLNLQGLTVLRLDECDNADPLLRCLAGKVPNLRVLQLVQSCLWATVEEVLPDLPPLEVLHVKFQDGKARGNKFRWETFDGHRETMRSLWLECTAIDLNISRRTIKYINECFEHDQNVAHWPSLEELALQTDDYQLVEGYLFENLRCFRALPGKEGILRPALDEKAAALRACETILTRYEEELTTKEEGISGIPELQVIAVTADDSTGTGITAGQNIRTVYFVIEFIKTILGRYAPILSMATAQDVRRLFPDLHLLEFERRERVWGETDGDLLV